jgi:hypothetical protein
LSSLEAHSIVNVVHLLIGISPDSSPSGCFQVSKKERP